MTHNGCLRQPPAVCRCDRRVLALIDKKKSINTVAINTRSQHYPNIKIQGRLCRSGISMLLHSLTVRVLMYSLVSLISVAIHSLVLGEHDLSMVSSRNPFLYGVSMNI